MKKDFVNTALKIIDHHSNNVNLISFTLAIVRRLASYQKYRDLIATNFLFTLITFVQIFYETQSKKADAELSYSHRMGISFIYKEILGCLGVLAAEERHR